MRDNKTNSWKWMVALLGILNIVLLVSIWRQPSQRQGPPQHMGEEGPAKMIIEELKFTPKQVEAFDFLKKDHQDQIRELRHEGKDLRDDFFNLLKTANPDEKLISQKADSISANQKRIEMVTFNHFKEVRKICDAEQQKRFDEIINEILHSMARPGKGPGRPEGPPLH